MFWAIASSVVVIYLYRKLNAERAAATPIAPAVTVEAELAALEARIAALEGKIAGSSKGEARP
ncbi:MAG: hypothetical protein BGN99_32105 [Alphaproteobacteria bacterium 65-37]|jgi:BMFP domain-containing protein YqiC|nr:MAG: hypothetical protein BGN99_32105 [Alphaproteobacteria bacterium 65-37]